MAATLSFIWPIEEFEIFAPPQSANGEFQDLDPSNKLKIV
jgi:hypothetical protein